MAKKKKPDDFFGEDTKFWMGRVVSVASQKKQVDGYGWGWRFKVRIFGAYTDEDVRDNEVHTATAMLGVSDGSGGGGRSRSLRIAQGDMVFGFYMAPDEGFPVIIGVFPRTRESETKSGFTAAVKKGLAPVEINEQGSAPIPVLNDNKSTKGPTNPGKTTPAAALQKQMGIDPNQPPQLGAIPNPAKPLTEMGKNLLGGAASDLLPGGVGEIASAIASDKGLGVDTVLNVAKTVVPGVKDFVNTPGEISSHIASGTQDMQGGLLYAAGNIAKTAAKTAGTAYGGPVGGFLAGVAADAIIDVVT